MQYHDLEAETYRFLRENRKAEAKILVARSLSALSPADAPRGQILMANVELVCSHLVTQKPRERVELALASEHIDWVDRCKAHLLGAHMANATEDLYLWRDHLTQMEFAIDRAPEWRGRWLRSLALYHEATGNVSEAERIHAECADWHRNNSGPHDDRDRLCYLGLALNDLSRFAVQRNDLQTAENLYTASVSLIPTDALQHVYAIICGVRIALVQDDLTAADQRLMEAELALEKVPYAHAQRQIQELRLAYYQRTGNGDAAQGITEKLRKAARLSRNMPALRRVEALAEPTM